MNLQRLIGRQNKNGVYYLRCRRFDLGAALSLPESFQKENSHLPHPILPSYLISSLNRDSDRRWFLNFFQKSLSLLFRLSTRQINATDSGCIQTLEARPRHVRSAILSQKERRFAHDHFFGPFAREFQKPVCRSHRMGALER